MKNEAFLPKKAFAGSNKHKLGTKGQARGEPGRSQKAPLTGLMVGEDVIIGPDDSGDWTNPQVQILGGGGSYTLDRLYKKAQGEAAEIKELIDAGEHKKAAYYLKQFKNTVDTIVAAKDELSKRHFGEAKQRLDPKCWKGYRKQGTKMKDGVKVNNCVKVKEEWEVELDSLKKLANIGGGNHSINIGSNTSITGTEKRRLEREHNIQPGTPEWFQLWFSRPYMTGEKPVGK